MRPAHGQRGDRGRDPAWRLRYYRRRRRRGPARTAGCHRNASFAFADLPGRTVRVVVGGNRAAIRPCAARALWAAPRLRLAAVGPGADQSLLGTAHRGLLSAIRPFADHALGTLANDGLAIRPFARRALGAVANNGFAVRPFAGRARGAFARSRPNAVRPFARHALGADLGNLLRIDETSAGLCLRQLEGFLARHALLGIGCGHRDQNC